MTLPQGRHENVNQPVEYAMSHTPPPRKGSLSAVWFILGGLVVLAVLYFAFFAGGPAQTPTAGTRSAVEAPAATTSARAPVTPPAAAPAEPAPASPAAPATAPAPAPAPAN